MYVTMNFRERIHQALFGEVERSKSSLETLRNCSSDQSSAVYIGRRSGCGPSVFCLNTEPSFKFWKLTVATHKV